MLLKCLENLKKLSRMIFILQYNSFPNAGPLGKLFLPTGKTLALQSRTASRTRPTPTPLSPFP